MRPDLHHRAHGFEIDEPNRSSPTMGPVFSDSTVPAGSELVTCMLHTTRGGEAGPFSQRTSIYLGIPGNQGEQGLSLAA